MLYDEKQLYNEGFNQNQVEEIIDGQMAGVDVSAYDKKSFLAVQMRQVRLGLMEGLDVSEYAHDFYDWFQMEEIRKGLMAGVDVTKYAAPSVTYDRMREVKEALILGIDLSPYIKLDAKCLHLLRDSIQNGYSISEFIEEGYEAPELEQICRALSDGLDIRPYIRTCMCANAIREIACGLRDRLDISLYLDDRLNWRQMREIRLGLLHRVDAGRYRDPLYSWRQMRELRLGLEEGLDVSRYSSFVYLDADMRRIREAMLRVLSDPDADGTDTGRKRSFGAFTIVISECRLKAYLLLEEPLSDAGEVLRALEELGIVCGIREDRLEELVGGQIPEKPVVIAEGVPPTRGADGWYEYFFDTKVNKQYKLLGDGTADYTDIKWFDEVEAGQKLAVYHEAQRGEAGRTVTGEELPGLLGRPRPMLTGSGITPLEDQRTYVASIGGRAELAMDSLRVTKLLVLDQLSLLDVKVVFDGTVYVRGKVESGTTIRASDDIVVDGLVENAQLEAGGNMLLRGGVCGAEAIHAKGDVTASFFEKAHVVANGTIQANYSRDSELHAGAAIHMIGAFAGGTAHAQLGIAVNAAGNSGNTPTLLQCELLDNVKKDARRMEEERAAVSREIEILTNSQADYEQMYPPQVRNAMDMYIRIECAIYIKKKQMQELLDRRAEIWRLREKVNQSNITVDNLIYPGVQVRIGTSAWEADEREHIVISKDGSGVKIETGRQEERKWELG